MNEFNETMKKWVQIDNEIRRLTEEKKEVTDELNEYIDANDIDRKKINVSLNDSNIKFVTTKIPQTLSFKYLEKCLTEIIDNEDQVNQIIEYVKNNREINEVTGIKRIYK